MVLTVYGYVAAWDLPDISPYVTKLCFYLTIAKIPFEYKNENLAELDKNAPYGKLPYIVDDDGTKVGDSNQIIEYLEKTKGKSLDDGLSPADKAVCLAFERMIGEHTYWSGIIEPRWRSDSGWATYIPHIVQGAEVTKALQGFLDAFRERILQGFMGQGMGRRDSPYVLKLYKQDIDALSDFMGEKKYFFDDKVRTIDAMVYGMLRHFVDQPQKWEGTGYVEGKKNLAAYLERMKAEFKV